MLGRNQSVNPPCVLASAPSIAVFQFDEYEKNKLIKEKYEISIESFDLKIKNLEDKLQKYYDLQEKISENDKIETQLIKAGLKLDELEAEKSSLNRKIDNSKFQINQ